jgi:FkbM family methyltransferase
MTFDLETVAHHSHVPRLMNGAPVLDVGARGFEFSSHFAMRGHRVIALDPDPEVTDPGIPGVTFLRMALGYDTRRERSLVLHPNPEARFLLRSGEDSQYGKIEVQATDILGLMDMLNVDEWDLVKLNCEGEEAEILSSWPGQVARQIVVSFHEHFRPIGEPAIEKVVGHLLQWYVPARHVKDARYGGGENYWDSVFVARGLEGA